MENKEIEAAEWVSVEERLPNVGETVLIVDKFGRVDIATYTKSGRWSLPYGELEGWVYAWIEIPKPPRMSTKAL